MTYFLDGEGHILILERDLSVALTRISEVYIKNLDFGGEKALEFFAYLF